MQYPLDEHERVEAESSEDCGQLIWAVNICRVCTESASIYLSVITVKNFCYGHYF